MVQAGPIRSGREVLSQYGLGGCDIAFLSLSLGESAFDPRSLKLEAKIKATRRLSLPVIFLHGGKDGVTPPKGSKEMAKKFADFQRIVLKGVGHFPPREAPVAVAKHLIRHFTTH